MTKKKALSIGIIILSVALAIVGYCVLPQTLTVQVGAGGRSGNTMPKLLGLLLPLGVSCVFAGAYYKTETSKNLLTAVFGLLLYILLFAFNL